MAKRGLILLPKVDINLAGNSLQMTNIGPSTMEDLVRENLPYWDAFDLPDNPILRMGLTPSLQFLASQSIVQKTNARPSFSGPMAELWVRAQFEAWRINEAREPGCWSLAQQGDFFWIPKEERVQTRVIEVKLYRALPVPGSDVSFEEILSFKQQRADELNALRAGLDELYFGVIDSSDIPRATNAAITRIQSAVSDLRKVANESWRTRLASTLKVDISLPHIANAGVYAGSGATAAISFDLPSALGAVAGVAAALLIFELKQKGDGLRIPANSNAAFVYAHHVEKELQDP